MLRNNIGNVVTNGMQILSVAATTGAHEIQNQKRARIANAASALNHMTEDELNQYGEMQANKIRDSISQYNAGGASPFQHLTPEEAGQYQSHIADNMRKAFIDVDEAMEDLESPEKNELFMKISRDIASTKVYSRAGRAFKPATIEEIIKNQKGEE